VLAAVGWLGMLVAVGPSALVFGWLLGVAVIAALSLLNGRVRLVGAALVTLAFIAMTFELGLFLVPSAMAVLLVPGTDRGPRPPRRSAYRRARRGR